MKDVKLENDRRELEVKVNYPKKSLPIGEYDTTKCTTRDDEDTTGQTGSSMLEQGQSPMHDTCVSHASNISPAPICRQFWKAGNYQDRISSRVAPQYGKSYLQVHPMFLHSNATSHKWAFGAIAELLDNAVDEIPNGATFVVVDKTVNPRDGSPALLIQDDGGGMDPEAMRQCMSFGFSGKKSNSAIGQYGNGFKTSTMRLGADVIVFSRHRDDSKLTQSIGLLSYTFLTRTASDRIVVPMVDYEFNPKTGKLETSCRYGQEHFMSNLSMLFKWSPYSTEAELLKQFDGIGDQGTKVIIYNLWVTDEGVLELDFDKDSEDIRICGDIKRVETKAAWKAVNEEHIANKLRYSLRVYLSILYLKLPKSFNILLRGRPVGHHNLADDMIFPEYILYRPQSGGCVEGQVVTTIGFSKGAPQVSVHGFSVYHKNRLILPFWPVVSYFDSRGRGVVGVLEANFIEPIHNKQEFEKTSLFQKLESRLKQMTWEYWDYHCGLIGYQVKKKLKSPEVRQGSDYVSPDSGRAKPVILNPGSLVQGGNTISAGSCSKRKEPESESLRVEQSAFEKVNRLVAECSSETQRLHSSTPYHEAANLKQEHEKLRARCLEHEKTMEELYVKVSTLRAELKDVESVYGRLMAEVSLLDNLKEERVNM